MDNAVVSRSSWWIASLMSAGLLLIGCEPQDRSADLAADGLMRAAATEVETERATAEPETTSATMSPGGEMLVGTWYLYRTAIREPGTTRWAYDDDPELDHRPFHRIALYDNGTLYGEKLDGGVITNFGGTWFLDGHDVVMRCGATTIAGEYTLEGDQFTVLMERADEESGADILLIMKPSRPLAKPDGYQDPAAQELPPMPGESDGGTNATPANATAAASTESSSGGVNGTGTFLWKPVAESDGKAVTLFPAKYRLNEGPVENQINGAYIDGGSRDGETPRRIYWPDGHNGNRIHARWSASGGSYGNGFKVVLMLKTGQEVSWTINNGGSRQEQ